MLVVSFNILLQHHQLSLFGSIGLSNLFFNTHFSQSLPGRNSCKFFLSLLVLQISSILFNDGLLNASILNSIMIVLQELAKGFLVLISVSRFGMLLMILCKELNNEVKYDLF